jgi:predicted nucleic acid-binding protein
VILLDTTCLVYAVGVDHERREPCMALMTAIGEQRVIARTTTQVIAEFAHVRGRRRDRSDASSLAEDYIALLGPLETVGEADISEALRIWQATPGVGTFDALLIAVAARLDVDALVTEDRALRAVELIPIMTAAEAVAAFG